MSQTLLLSRTALLPTVRVYNHLCRGINWFDTAEMYPVRPARDPQLCLCSYADRLDSPPQIQTRSSPGTQEAQG